MQYSLAKLSDVVAGGCRLTFVVLAATISAGAIGGPIAQGEQRVTGIARFVGRAQLTFGIAGRLETLSVEEGDEVEAGQVIATLWDAAAKANLEEATSRANARGALEAAEAEWKSAELAWLAVRRANANRPGAFSLQHETQSELAYERARKILLQQREAVEIAVAAKSTAEAQLDALRLTAPFSGTVVRCYKAVGEGIDSVSAVVELVDSQRMRVEFFVTLEDVSHYRPGGSVNIFPADLPATDDGRPSDQPAIGTIGFVDLSLQPVRRVIRAWADLPRPDWMRDGMKVTVTPRTDFAEPISVSPQAARDHGL